MLKNGIYIAPSQFEALFLSITHTEENIEKFLDVFKNFDSNQ
jgi:glutamate-1-semialdehyde 2,1-aminomutase